MEELTDLSISPVRSSHFTSGNPKVIFHHFYSYTSDYLRYIGRKNSNCCIASLAVYLLLFSASYYLHSPIVLRLGHATGGARVLIWTCCGLRQRLVATWAEFQHSVVYCATDQCRERLEASTNAESGHSEHLL